MISKNIIIPICNVITLLVGVIMYLLSGTININAAENNILAGNSTVTVSYIIEDANINYEISKCAGILIGSKNSGINKVITCLDNIELSDEKKINIANACNIAVEEVDKLVPIIRVSLSDVELKFDATEMTRSEELNLVVLNLSQEVNDENYAIFNVDEKTYETGTPLIVYDILGAAYGGMIDFNTSYNNNTYIGYSMDREIEADGCGLYNSKGEFIGMCQKNNPCGGYMALSAKSIATILEKVNVEYEVAEKKADISVTEIKRYTLVFFIISLVLLVTNILLMIYIIIFKKKMKKKDLEAKELESKRAPKSHEPYRPRDLSNSNYMQGIDMSGFAPSDKLINVKSDDTAILGATVKAVVLRCGEKSYQIVVDRFPFVIGKEISQVDYAVTNSSVSRRHLAIYCNNGIYQIADLKSKNGTYLNKMRLIPERIYDIKPGDNLMLANEKFIITVK